MQIYSDDFMNFTTMYAKAEFKQIEMAKITGLLNEITDSVIDYWTNSWASRLIIRVNNRIEMCRMNGQRQILFLSEIIRILHECSCRIGKSHRGVGISTRDVALKFRPRDFTILHELAHDGLFVSQTEYKKKKKNQLFTHCLYSKSDFTFVFIGSENGCKHSLRLQNSRKMQFEHCFYIKCKIKIRLVLLPR